MWKVLLLTDSLAAVADCFHWFWADEWTILSILSTIVLG